MKKVFRILSFMAILFTIACEDIYLHDGSNGTNAPIMYKTFDKANNMYVTWLDRGPNPDKILTLPQDTILLREDKEGTKYVQFGNCMKVIQIIGLIETEVGSVCNGKNVSIKSTPIPDQNNPNIIISNKVDFYSDEDGDGVVTAPDILRTSIIVDNGKRGDPGQIGPMGSAGITPTITREYTNDSILVTFTTGSNVTRFGMSKIYSISVQATQTPLGVIYLLYYDKDGDKKFDSGDVWLAENLIKNGDPGEPGKPGDPGTPGGPGTSLACLTNWYNFQANERYWDNTGFWLKGFKFSEEDGALYLHEQSGYILFPPFGSVYNNFLGSMLRYGSEDSYNILLKAVYSDGSEKVIKEFHLDGNPSFEKTSFNTYSIFEYYSDLSSFKGVYRMKIEAEKDLSVKSAVSVKSNTSDISVPSTNCIGPDLHIDDVWFLTGKEKK